MCGRCPYTGLVYRQYRYGRRLSNNNERGQPDRQDLLSLSLFSFLHYPRRNLPFSAYSVLYTLPVQRPISLSLAHSLSVSPAPPPPTNLLSSIIQLPPLLLLLTTPLRSPQSHPPLPRSPSRPFFRSPSGRAVVLSLVDDLTALSWRLVRSLLLKHPVQHGFQRAPVRLCCLLRCPIIMLTDRLQSAESQAHQ